jgi:hypothetical protein
MQWCEEYWAPVAGVAERTSDLASRAVGRALSAAPGAADEVRAILHAQCTLDQQMIASACLRIQTDHFQRASSVLMVGQLGTAGIPATLRLAAMEVASGGLASVSASDKWMAPFVRRVPGLVTYGDAGGACLIGSLETVAAPVAVIEACATWCRSTTADLWTAPASEQREAVFALAKDCIAHLLDQVPDVRRAELLLAGDGYGRDMSDRLVAACGLSPRTVDERYADVHLSTAAPLWALRSIVAASARRGEAVRAVVWTASPAGHAGAMLVRCDGGAIETPDGWTSRSYGTPACAHGATAAN